MAICIADGEPGDRRNQDTHRRGWNPLAATQRVYPDIFLYKDVMAEFRQTPKPDGA